MHRHSTSVSYREWSTFETFHESGTLSTEEIDVQYKWSPAEAVLWVQLSAFPHLAGQELLDSVADLSRWKHGVATRAQCSYGKEWRRIGRQLQIDDAEATNPREGRELPGDLVHAASEDLCGWGADQG